MTDDKPVESRFKEYADFAKKHKIVAVLVLIWLVAPTIWSVVVTVKGWNTEDLQATIDNQNIKIIDKNVEIQRLETLLTPFRTLALEKFTGSEQEALRKLADYVTDLQAKYQEQRAKLAIMDKELQNTKAMTGPPVLTPVGKYISKNSDGGYEVIIPFTPSNNGRVDGYSFKGIIINGNAIFTSFGGSVEHHAMVGGGDRINEDGKVAECFFNPLAGKPTLKIMVSASCTVELTGSHLDKMWTVVIE